MSINGDKGCVSVVIVNYNAGNVLIDAIRAVLNSTVPVQVIVVDNDSKDESTSQLRSVFTNDSRLKIIGLDKNYGFARATNVALRAIDTDWILILNPDCVVKPDTIERVQAVMEVYPSSAIGGCLIQNPDGTEQQGCRRAVPTPWYSFVRAFHLDRIFSSIPRFRTFLLNNEPLPDSPVCVDAVSGAFMLLRHKALEEVGMLDEGYFLHCEDLDWCMRFHAAGWQIVFVPDAKAVHLKGTCSKSRPIFVEWHKHKGMVRFYRKFFRHQYPFGLMWLVILGVWLRFGLLAVGFSVRRVFGILGNGRN